MSSINLNLKFSRVFLAFASIFIYGSLYSQTSTLYDFNTPGQLSTYFNGSGSGLASVTQQNSGGISNSGYLSVPNSSVDAIYATKDSYSIGPVGSSYTFESFIKSEGNGGYGGMGFTASSPATKSSTSGVNRPADALGVSVHGGGFVFHNGSTDIFGSWSSPSSGSFTAVKQSTSCTDLINATSTTCGSPDRWYKIIFKVMRATSTTFNMRVEVWPANVNGTLRYPSEATAIYEVNGVTNTAISNSPKIHSYFNFSGWRITGFDNYAINLAGGATVIQAGAPVVLTTSTTLNNGVVTVNGNVTSENGSSITERGFVYGLTANPTTADTKVVVAGTGTGTFSGTTSSLSSGTYYFRAYATNSTGTSYGAQEQHTIAMNCSPNVQFKLSPPGITYSAIQGQAGSRTESFNSLTIGALSSSGSFAVGSFTKSGTASINSDIYYGARPDNSNTGFTKYLGISSSAVVNVILTDPSRYLGFWWGGGDGGNRVTIYGSCGGNEVQIAQFTTSTVTSLLSGATVTAIDGNSYASSAYKGINYNGSSNEPFAYINLQLDDPNLYFTRLEFTQTTGGGFEVDNITTSTGYGAASATTPSAPTITSITTVNGSSSVVFTSPSSNGGSAITNYEYSTDNGVTWTAFSPAVTTSPAIISGFSDGSFTLFMRAVNSIGSGNSSNAFSFSTNATPTITAISDQILCANSTPNPVQFEIGDLETPLADLGLSVSSSNSALLPVSNISFSGTTGSRTLNYTTISGVYGTSTVTITVQDSNGATASESFTVQIDEDKIQTSTNVPTLQAGTPLTLDTQLTINETNIINGALVLISAGFVSGDVLAYTGTLPAGVTRSYNSSTGVLTFTGNMTASELQAIFRAVTINTTSNNSQDRTITFNLGSALPLSANNHYYQFVTAPGISWTAAKTAAEDLSFFGKQGYLATVTSAVENQFILSKIQGQGWMGASDAQTEGVWKWMTGPEAGTQFWQGAATGIVVGGLYNNWYPGEPNNAGDEDYAHFLTDGRWNDYPLSLGNIQGYVVEFGGMASDPCVITSATKTIHVKINVAPTNILLDQNGLAENNPVGSLVGTLSSTDADQGDTHTYTLVDGIGSNDNSSFTITGDQLKAAISFDFEAKSSYTIRIKTTDAGGLGFEKVFIINIINVNETPTNLLLSRTSVYEKNPIGITIGTLNSIDPDTGDTHTYTLSSGDLTAFGLSGNQLKALVSFNYNSQNSHTIRAKTTDSGNLSFEKTHIITVIPAPIITGTGNYPGSQQSTVASASPSISKGYSSQLNVIGSGIVSYNWSPSTGLNATNIANPIATPSQTTTYTVTVTHSSGAVYTQTITVVVKEDYNVTPHNILTPNGDGNNDTWIIENLSSYPLNKVSIFDAAGRMVYTKSSYSNDWDGFNLMEGSYYYIIDFGPNVAPKRGFITIVR